MEIPAVEAVITNKLTIKLPRSETKQIKDHLIKHLRQLTNKVGQVTPSIMVGSNTILDVQMEKI